jgi:anti-anti-sigma factor
VIVKMLPGMNPERTNMQRVGEILARSRLAPKIIVNLSLAERISSTFVNGLLRLLKLVQAADGRLILCGVQPLFREIFQITNLEALFDFADDQETALGRLR